MKTLYVLIAATLVIGCSKQEPLSTQSNLDKFTGIWKTDNFGGNPFEVVIQKIDDETILMHGQVTAKPSGNSFKSDPVNSVIHRGELINGILEYCQQIGSTSVCGDFKK